MPAVSPCLYFTALAAFLPAALPGLRPTKDEGSTGKYGEVTVSEAERTFGEEGREVDIRIVDTTLVGKLREKIKAAAADARSRPEADPLAPLVLAGSVGFVRYDPGETRAEANLLVGERFVVALSTRGFEGTDEVRRLAGKLDLAGLSKLR